MQDFKRLTVWQKSHALALDIYKASRGFPNEERFGLTSQIRRASYSIPANIAEGCGRGSRLDLKRFLHMSMGSACEVEYFLYLARDLGIMSFTEQGATRKKCHRNQAHAYWTDRKRRDSIHQGLITED